MEAPIYLAPFLDETDSYHAMRFNVKSETISKSQNGSLHVSVPPSGSSTFSISAEFQSDNGGEPYYYSGSQQAAKDIDCVLLWDEASSSYVLHRLSTFSRLSKVKTKPNLSIAVTKPSDLPKPALASPELRRAVSSSQIPTSIQSASPVLVQRSASQTPIANMPRMPASPRLVPLLNRGNASSSSEEEEEEEEASSSDDESEDDFNDLAKSMERAASQTNTPITANGSFGSSQNSYLANLGKKTKR